MNISSCLSSPKNALILYDEDAKNGLLKTGFQKVLGKYTPGFPTALVLNQHVDLKVYKAPFTNDIIW